MSRRDTIIIAVLINAGLLTLLFATAMNMDEHEIKKHLQVQNREEAVEPTQQLEVARPVTSTEVLEMEPERDEIDQALAAEMAEPAPAWIEVTVARGDVLGKIASKYDTTVEAIMRLNSLSTSRLHIGQVVRIPTGEVEVQNEPEVEELAQEEEPEELYYTVQAGDSPWLIARRNQLNLDELLDLNGLDEAKARRLRPGDKLRIR